MTYLTLKTVKIFIEITKTIVNDFKYYFARLFYGEYLVYSKFANELEQVK